MKVKNKIKESINIDLMLRSINHPLLFIDNENNILMCNSASEVFFGISSVILEKNKLDNFLPFSNPLINLVSQAKEKKISINEYSVKLNTINNKNFKTLDIQITYTDNKQSFLTILLIERDIAVKFNKQYLKMGSTKSIVGLSSMLAHEIKNPLSGIRGAAQLLGENASKDDFLLTELICEETDRITKLVDSMEVFTNERAIVKEIINIHSILNRVRRIAENGFSKGIKFIEIFDPSLPDIEANKDQLIQVFLNLIKNSTEAITKKSISGEIIIRTSFMSGLRIALPSSNEKVNISLSVSIEDNGPGIPEFIIENFYEPFISDKNNGSGLGLAIAMKIIQDHDGIIEFDSSTFGTKVTILLPIYSNKTGDLM
jgi:two-component system, NtrC family, nitrogen regulation sensor histidine kinase GlnL